ncbi:DUF4465 domain-containing protein [Bacteroidota bacterium]
MKYTHKNIVKVFSIISCFIFIVSCEETTLESRVPVPNDVTFNELSLGRFTYNIPDAPITSGDVTANIVNNGNGNYSGFALSNKSWRSFPWSLSPTFGPAGGVSAADKQTAIDSCRFSAFTRYVNTVGNYLVGHAKDDNAYITLALPSVVEHVLITNTTYSYLLEFYGSNYTGKNPKIDKWHSSSSQFYLPGPNDVDVDKIYDVPGGYVKLVIEGSLNGSTTGSIDLYMAVNENSEPNNPEYKFVVNDWIPVDLTELGKVDKVLFKMESSYVDGQGNLLYSPYFCLDGIRLMK